MSRSFGQCGVCRREIPVKHDGRLRVHLSATSRAGRREQCDGSGAWSATETDLPVITRPAAFNAREEWAKADSLSAEYEDMQQVGAASDVAMRLAAEALNRAVDDADQLAPWWSVWPYAEEGEVA